MNEVQPLVFVESRSAFQEKSHHFHILALVIHKVCDARIVSRNLIIERCSAGGKLLIETMIEEIEKVVLEASVYQKLNDSYKYTLDNFHLSRLHFEEPNTILNSRVAFYNWKTLTETLIEEK